MQITITSSFWLLLLILLIALQLLLVIILITKPFLRYLIGLQIKGFSDRLLSDKYTQNLMELWPAGKRISVLNILEIGLRAQNGKIITRPLGSPKHFPGFDSLMFAPQIMTRLSLPEGTQIDMQVTIGPKAYKPMTLDIPIIIGAMAYGIALSEEAKRALARAAKTLKTSTCSGEGPFLPEERMEAGKYTLQISRWAWGARTQEQIDSADMLEVQMGQGSDMGAVTIDAVEFQGRAQELSGLAPDEMAIAFPAPPGVQKQRDWPNFMKSLREKANGIPIALKIMATGHLEDDLAAALKLKFDAVIIDGAQGGSHATTPIKQDDFGIPSLFALVRAVRFLEKERARDRISLIIAGGFFTPGECLKAMALGADAVYMATVPLLALTHSQVSKVIPWEPPTTLVFYDSPSKGKLDIEQAATSVVNVITSMVLEMEEGMRALGKASLKELNPDDLVALDSLSAEVTGVKRIY
ncbi:FMN-binding glutamate synthase family protein [Desulfosporosinus meridiei]|uniref:Glutamate synthase family protein n=1 Tax=Desulfosporosinus meridiei (strain ATCC BAA-275 / DSM 13257 / KCTC 12902 / NCIMB 13706 / S10) TaxID=768704 RepID=J7J1G8_DESMD|nr:FMN-binding glutamate synthase family protein [Desulfosporosinus meridiei]AFQ46209.1 glutamate synthase family protein [Desulfosporosinus meridiei DSM 13257]